MLRLQGITKSFEGQKVLSHLNLHIQKGEVTVLLGPSGSGKTTLLRCINCLEKAEEGTLFFAGEEISLPHISKKQIHTLRTKTAMVFQHYNLFANKTVLENVTEALVVVQKKSVSAAKDLALPILKAVGLSEKLHVYPSKLSGGQKQRVGIARAMALEPEVLLLDEPTSALDPELVGEVLDVMTDLAQKGFTMVVVTHEMAFARDVGHHIVFMEKGSIVEEGDAKTIFSKPKEARTQAFLSRFIGVPEYYI